MEKRGGQIDELLTLGENELASGRESFSSRGVRAGDPSSRRHQGGRLLDEGSPGRSSAAPDAVRMHRTLGSVS